MIKGKPEKLTVSEDRERMIAEAAYYLAQNRSFMGGDPEEDWYEAEEEIDRRIEEADEEKAR